MWAKLRRTWSEYHNCRTGRGRPDPAEFSFYPYVFFTVGCLE